MKSLPSGSRNIPTSIKYTLQAKCDLKNIFSYSAREHGKLQAEFYYQSLREKILMLEDFPHIGTAKEQLKEGYRALDCNDHVAFYRIREEIEIVRILHKKMNYPDKLP